MSLRSTIVRAARRADRAVAHLSGRRRVLIEARSPMNLEVLRPIWEALRRDDRVSLAFTSEEQDWIRPPLAEAGLAQSLLAGEHALWRRFDVAINADPWNAIPLRRCWRRVNVFHGVAGKYDLDNPQVLAQAVDFSIYDRVLFPNSDRLSRYVRSGVIAPERAVLAGFPKVDDLITGRWAAHDVRRSLGLDPGLETVLYAPTFSPASSLHLAGEAIVEQVLASGRNVVVKLHDRSMVPHPKYTGNVDWPARLARFDGHPRYAFVTDAHAGPYLAAADVMVTDHSTIGFEFGLLDRPIVVFDAPGLLAAARINPEKWRQLRAMATVVRDADALPAAIAQALAHPERQSAERRANAAALFAYAGQATARSLDVIYALLDLPPRAAASAARVATGAPVESLLTTGTKELS